MKKLLSLLLALTLLFTLASCTVTKPKEKGEYLIGVVDGAPSLAVASIYGGYKTTIPGEDVTINAEIKADPAVITAGLANGTYDMAILPLNVGAKLFNKGVKLKLASVDIFGVLYMIGSEQVTDLEDLKGQVVYNIGRGGTPDLTFKYILTKAGIEFEEGATATDSNKVYMQYVSASSELIPMLKTGKAKYGIMGEPAVSQANTVAGTQIVLDLKAEWEKAQTNNYKYVQAGLFVMERVYENKPLVDSIYQKLEQNDEFLIENMDSLVDLIKQNGSALSVALNAEVIARCNIENIKASLVKEDVEAYFTAIKEFDGTFIGGDLPSNDFYL